MEGSGFNSDQSSWSSVLCHGVGQEIAMGNVVVQPVPGGEKYSESG
jgi:hypothetical protein